MNNRPGQLRTYNWVVKLPIGETSNDCTDFRAYVRESIIRIGQLQNYEEVADPQNCVVRFRVKCQSCGNSSPNRFRQNLLLRFPNTDARELFRQYS
jgi:hypothetical protein